MTSLTFKVSDRSRSFLRSLDDLDRDKVFKALDKFFDQQGSLVAGFITTNFLSGQLLGRRTGALARSVIGRSVRLNGVPGLRVGVFRGPALAYARIHAEGGTIKPRKAKALAVPVKGGPALTAAGVERYGGPRNFPGGLKFIPFRGSGIAVGALYRPKDLERIRGARGAGRDSGGKFTSAHSASSLRNVKAAYLLLRRVFVKKKDWLNRGFRDYLPTLGFRLEQFLRDLIESKATGKSVNRESLGPARDPKTGRFVKR